MSKTTLCTKCKRRISVDATVCICGWSASGSYPSQHYDPQFAKPCSAKGCPLGGTFSRDTLKDGNEWWCYIHSADLSSNLAGLTIAIRAQPELLEDVITLSQAYAPASQQRVARHNLMSAVIKHMEIQP